jgi:hypothetical protein
MMKVSGFAVIFSLAAAEDIQGTFSFASVTI